VLHDKIALLHRLLKENRRLISDCTTKQVASANAGNVERPDARTEEALYIFVCVKRFDRLSKDIDSLRKLMDNPKFGPRAG